MPQTCDQILAAFKGEQSKAARDLFATANLFETRAEVQEARAKVFREEARQATCPARMAHFLHHAGIFEESAKVAREEVSRLRAQAAEHALANDQVSLTR